MSRTTLQATLVLVWALATTGQGIPARVLIPGKPLGAGHIPQLSYSPDGRFLAVVATVGFQIRDADSGQVLNTIVDDFPARPRRVWEPWVSELVWSPDGRRIARAATGIEIRDPMASAPERILRADAADGAFHELVWSPAGNRLAARSEAGIVVWELNTGRRMAIPEKPPNSGDPEIGGVSWAPDGGRLAIVTGYRETEAIDLWDVRRIVLVRRIQAGRIPPEPPSDRSGSQFRGADESKVEWSPDGQSLALYSGFSGLSLWNPSTGALLRRVAEKDNIVSLRWRRDSKVLCLGTVHQFRLVRWDTGAPVYTLPMQTEDWVHSSAVSADGERLAASFIDGGILLWRGRGNQPSARIQTGAFADLSLMLSPDLNRIAAQSPLARAGVWDLASGGRLATFEAPNWGPGEYMWAPDGRTLAIVHGVGLTLELLQPSSGEKARTIKLPSGNASEYTTASWSPDGTRILVEGARKAVVVRLQSGTLEAVSPGTGPLLWTAGGDLARLAMPAGPFFVQVLQAPDFRLVAVREPNQLTLWDTQENRVLWTVAFRPDRTLYQVAWSPDSQRLAYFSQEGVLEVWDRGTGKVVQHWTTPGMWPWSVLSYLTWREKLVAVENLGGAIRLWREP